MLEYTKYKHYISEDSENIVLVINAYLCCKCSNLKKDNNLKRNNGMFIEEIKLNN